MRSLIPTSVMLLLITKIFTYVYNVFSKLDNQGTVIQFTFTKNNYLKDYQAIYFIEKSEKLKQIF